MRTLFCTVIYDTSLRAKEEREGDGVNLSKKRPSMKWIDLFLAPIQMIDSRSAVLRRPEMKSPPSLHLWSPKNENPIVLSARALSNHFADLARVMPAICRVKEKVCD
jgi:hypothetical protein